MAGGRCVLSRDWANQYWYRLMATVSTWDQSISCRCIHSSQCSKLSLHTHIIWIKDWHLFRAFLLWNGLKLWHELNEGSFKACRPCCSSACSFMLHSILCDYAHWKKMKLTESCKLLVAMHTSYQACPLYCDFLKQFKNIKLLTKSLAAVRRADSGSLIYMF